MSFLQSKPATYIALFFAITGAVLPVAVKSLTDAGLPTWAHWATAAMVTIGAIKLAYSEALNAISASQAAAVAAKVVPPAVIMFAILLSLVKCAAPSPSQAAGALDFNAKLAHCRDVGFDSGSYTAYDKCEHEAGLK